MTGGRRGEIAGRSAGASLLLASLALHGCGAAAPGSGRGAARHEVELRNFAFLPAALEVAAGDSVVWSNRDVVVHNATEEGGAWGTGAIGAGGSAARVFTVPGEHEVVCTLHPTMTATITVR